MCNVAICWAGAALAGGGGRGFNTDKDSQAPLAGRDCRGGCQTWPPQRAVWPEIWHADSVNLICVHELIWTLNKHPSLCAVGCTVSLDSRGKLSKIEALKHIHTCSVNTHWGIFPSFAVYRAMPRCLWHCMPVWKDAKLCMSVFVSFCVRMWECLGRNEQFSWKHRALTFVCVCGMCMSSSVYVLVCLSLCVLEKVFMQSNWSSFLKTCIHM